METDHKLRENGVHAELHGLQAWFELSLVDLGGLAGAKIVSPGGAKLQQHRIKVLAADNSPANIHLISMMSPETSEENEEMDTKELLARLETKIEEASALKAEKQALVVEKDDLATRLEAAETENKALSVDPDDKLKAKDKEIAATRTRRSLELKATIEKDEKVLMGARALVTKLSIMAGDADSTFDESTAEELIAKFDEYVVNLKKIVLGGTAASTESTEDNAGPAPVSAFRIVK